MVRAVGVSCSKQRVAAEQSRKGCARSYGGGVGNGNPGARSVGRGENTQTESKHRRLGRREGCQISQGKGIL